MIAWTARIESDDRGFELHIESDEGTFVFNIHGCAEQLWDSAVKQIGPWLLERDAARRELDTGVADDPAQQAVLDRIRGEEARAEFDDHYSVHADLLYKRMREDR